LAQKEAKAEGMMNRA